MNIIIRQAQLDDLDRIAFIENTCFPEAEAASKTQFYQRLVSFKDSFFVAEHFGQIIGFINGAVIDEPTISDILFDEPSLHKPSGMYQTIFGLDVMPDYRHQGIAIKLMNHMIDYAKSMKRKGIILTCKENLIPFYNQFGYVNQGISDSVHGGATWYDMTLLF